MIPAHWLAYRREDDDELLGYIVPSDNELFAPVTVFGYPLADGRSQIDAERVLDSVGLSYLADRWMLRVIGREAPISVQIVEVSPERVVVQNVDYHYEGDYGMRFHLDVPETGEKLTHPGR